MGTGESEIRRLRLPTTSEFIVGILVWVVTSFPLTYAPEIANLVVANSNVTADSIRVLYVILGTLLILEVIHIRRVGGLRSRMKQVEANLTALAEALRDRIRTDGGAANATDSGRNETVFFGTLGGALIGAAIGSLFGQTGTWIGAAAGSIGGWAIELYHIRLGYAESGPRATSGLEPGDIEEGETTPEQTDVETRLDALEESLGDQIEELRNSLERSSDESAETELEELEEYTPLTDPSTLTSHINMVRGVLAQSPNKPMKVAEIAEKSDLAPDPVRRLLRAMQSEFPHIRTRRTAEGKVWYYMPVVGERDDTADGEVREQLIEPRYTPPDPDEGTDSGEEAADAAPDDEEELGSTEDTDADGDGDEDGDG